MDKDMQLKQFQDKLSELLQQLREASGSFPFLHAINISIAVRTESDGERTGWHCKTVGVTNATFDEGGDGNGWTMNEKAIIANIIGFLTDPSAKPYVKAAMGYMAKEAKAKGVKCDSVRGDC